MKRPLVLLLVALVAALVPPPVWSGQFTVGVEAHDYLPIYSGKGGGYQGFARELLDAFATKAGHQFTYQPMPIARLYNEYLVKKRLDLKFPDNPQWAVDLKKDAKVVYSTGLVNVTEGLMVLPGNKGRPVASLRTMAQIRGFTPHPFAALINSQAVRVTEVNDMHAGLSMVIAGRVDGVYLGKTAANYFLVEVMGKPGALVFDDGLPNARNDFTLSSIAHPEVVKELNVFLANEKELVNRLKAKHHVAE